MRTLLFVIAISAGIVGCSHDESNNAPAAAARAPVADTVYINGKIFTVNDGPTRSTWRSFALS